MGMVRNVDSHSGGGVLVFRSTRYMSNSNAVRSAGFDRLLTSVVRNCAGSINNDGRVVTTVHVFKTAFAQDYRKTKQDEACEA